MEIKIINKRENTLLGRQELAGELKFTGATPSYTQLKKELAAQLKVAEETVAVKNISTAFGATKAQFSAFVYTSKEQLALIEPKLREKKAKTAEEAAPAAKAAA